MTRNNPSARRHLILTFLLLSSIFFLAASIRYQKSIYTQAANPTQTAFKGILETSGSAPGSHLLTITVGDQQGTRTSQQISLTLTPAVVSPLPSGALCLSVHLKNRERERQGDHGIAATIEIRNQNTGEVLRTTSASDSQGKLTVTDATVLGKLPRDVVTPYRITVKPEGHLPAVITGIKDLFSVACKVLPATAVGDFNGDEKLTIADFTRLVRFYLTGKDTELGEYYNLGPQDRLRFDALIAFIREMRQSK